MTHLMPSIEQIGEYAAHMFKAGGVPVKTYSLAGRLYATPKGWVLLSVPNALVRGAFDALHEVGLELPYNSNGQLNGHISVFRPEEIEQIGGTDKIQERGHSFRFNLGPLQTCEPDGWKEMDRVYFIKVESKELEDLRKSYGLSPRPKNNEYDFHITVAVRRRTVLRHNDVVKQSNEKVADVSQRVRLLMPTQTGYLMELFDNPKYPENLGKFRFPGGGVNPGETLEQAAVREAAEEFGADLSNRTFNYAGHDNRPGMENEHYLELADHGLSAGSFSDAANPGYKVTLFDSRPEGDKYIGPVLSSLVKPVKQATSKPVPADANDPADREDCPHCGTLHERDNGRCNRCGELWPAKSASLVELFGDDFAVKEAKGVFRSLVSGLSKKPPTSSMGAVKSVLSPPGTSPAASPFSLRQLAASAAKSPVQTVKNQFGFGPDGPLSSPVPVSKPTGLGKANPLSWTRFGVDRGLTALADKSPAGKAVATTARATGHALTTNPLRSVMDAVRPGAGRHAGKVTAVSTAAPLAYGGYKAQRAMPDAVDSELERAGVDPEVRDSQWWRTWKAQPKLLWRSFAPESLGGDTTPVGKFPSRVLSRVVTDSPTRVDVYGSKPTAAKVVTRSPSNYLPTPATVLKNTAARNVIPNLQQGMPGILAGAAADTAKELKGNAGSIRQSPLVTDIAETIDPRLYKEPAAQDALLKTYVGDAKDEVKQEMTARGFLPPHPGMKFHDDGSDGVWGNYYLGYDPSGKPVWYLPRAGSYYQNDPTNPRNVQQRNPPSAGEVLTVERPRAIAR